MHIDHLSPPLRKRRDLHLIKVDCHVWFHLLWRLYRTKAMARLNVSDLGFSSTPTTTTTTKKRRKKKNKGGNNNHKKGGDGGGGKIMEEGTNNENHNIQDIPLVLTATP